MCVFAAMMGCGKEKKEREVSQTAAGQKQAGGGEKASDSIVGDSPYSPRLKLQGAALDSLRVMKKRFDITRDEYWEDRGGVLANLYFEVWYPVGRVTVTHGMYVIEELMPARKKFEDFFGQAPRELLVIRFPNELDGYKQLTGREWWYYSEIKGDSMTFVPIYILAKRGISPVAIPHEYYQWAVRKITQNGAPRWLEEGMASYLSGEGELLLNQMYEFSQGDVSMSPEKVEDVLQGEVDRRDSRIAYYRSYRMIQQLIDKHGEEKVKQAVVLIGQGNTLDQAFMRALNASYNAVLQEASDYTVDLTKKKKS
jgi:hypothetical protein